jgi:hypothetical protein
MAALVLFAVLFLVCLLAPFSGVDTRRSETLRRPGSFIR